MRVPLGATVALLALLCGAAAEPSTPFHGDTAHSTGCAQDQAVQDRLEILEETVEKTVEHLETEMKDILGLLEGLAWTLPPALASTPDLLGGNGQLSEKHRQVLSPTRISRSDLPSVSETMGTTHIKAHH
ncbi:placenta-specific protein 9 [Suncus etruscus]|uniref:placenta-specific protein 9 n=1 Tax=Suncus etruscus TaxID=109475 RepID=UPI00210F6D96|nr:placenta-specific protein 9 [Suncus etruscus]